MSTRTPQKGFTMLEVLISIVVIAFGLLGVAGLQAYALKHNHSASLRLTATALAADMIDRMRANVTGITNGQYNSPTTGAYQTAVPSCNIAGGACSTTDLATNDRFEWALRVQQALPGGVGIVCVDSTPTDGTGGGDPQCDNAGGGAMYVIKIWWTDHRTRTAATTGNPERQLFWTAFNP